MQLERAGEDMHFVPDFRRHDALCHLSSAFDHAGVDSGLSSEVSPPAFREGGALDASDLVSGFAPCVQHGVAVLGVRCQQRDAVLARRGVAGFGGGSGSEDELLGASAGHVSRSECRTIHQPSTHSDKDAVVGGAQRMGVSR